MQLFSYLSVCRPQNAIISALSILVSAIISNKNNTFYESANWLNVFFLCLSGAFITLGGNALNDYFDVEIDRINKPHRPIPSGKVSSKGVLIISIILIIIGIAVGFIVNIIAFIITIIASILIVLYNKYWKRQLIIGNLVVSLLTALAFIFGGVAVGHIKASIIPAVFSFLFHLGREIIKDVEDIDGDIKGGNANTIPIYYGSDVALKVVSIIYFILIIFTIIPYFLKIYNIYYLLTVLIGVNFVLFYVIVKLIFVHYKDVETQRKQLGRLSSLLKADMLIGLLAIYVGS